MSLKRRKLNGSKTLVILLALYSIATSLILIKGYLQTKADTNSFMKYVSEFKAAEQKNSNGKVGRISSDIGDCGSYVPVYVPSSCSSDPTYGAPSIDPQISSYPVPSGGYGYPEPSPSYDYSYPSPYIYSPDRTFFPF